MAKLCDHFFQLCCVLYHLPACIQTVMATAQQKQEVTLTLKSSSVIPTQISLSLNK